MNNRRNQHGFTLLEMLVALAVLAIAALSLVRLDVFTTRSTTALNRNVVAQIVANNAVATLLTDPAPPTIGTDNSSVTNGGIVWRVNARVAATANPSLLRIDIDVSGASGGHAALITIRSAG